MPTSKFGQAPKNVDYRDDPFFDKFYREPVKFDESFRTLQFPGFHKIFDAKFLLSKIFWISVVFCMLFLAVHHVFQTARDFWTSPITTAYTIKTSRAMYLPQVYLCPPYSIRRNFTEKNSQKSQIFEQIRREMMLESLGTLAVLENLAIGQEMLNLDYYGLKKKQAEMGVEKSSFFLGCSFTQYTASYFPCNLTYKVILDADYGTCFLIDVTHLSQVTPAQGFFLILNAKMGNSPETPRNLAPKFKGVHFSLEREISPATDKQILVPLNSYTRIDIRQTDLGFMNVERGQNFQPCQISSNFEYEILKLTRYSMPACQFECRLKIWIEHCNCLPSVDEVFVKEGVTRHYTYCTYRRMLQCRKKLSFHQKISNCKRNCRVACEDTQYVSRVSFQPLNHNAFPYVPPGTTVADLAYVQIAHPTLDAEKFDQSPSMNLDDAISNVGGQIGLWLGFSMFSIMQIPIALFTWFWVILAKKSLKPLIGQIHIDD